MKLLSKEIINDVALTMGIAPSYVEKDWYLVQILNLITQLNNKDIKVIFSGGTCLSKAYGYINRFSEDIDFSVTGLENATRKERGEYRDDLIEIINSVEGFSVEMDSIHSRDENRFSNFYIDYPKQFELGTALRNNLKIELSFKETYLPTKQLEIKSFVGNYLPDSPVANINCISFIETAANKFNALLWRTDIKDRSQPYNHMTNDPALMRHLYDLSCLYPMISQSKEFSDLTQKIYQIDCKRGDKTRQLSLEEFCQKTLIKLKEDKEYKKEYEQFVEKMVYSGAIHSFEQALHDFEQLVQKVLKK